MSNVSLYLSYARIAQYESAAANRKNSIFKGGVLVPDYSRLLYILQIQIGKRFALLPSDPTLTATSEYMYSLSGGRTINTTPVTTPFIIVIQPISQTVNAASNVSFSVTVAGGVPAYTYQWYKNGVLIVGQTNSVITLNAVTTANAGIYTCVIKDSTGDTLTSIPATLTVNTPALVGSYYYGDTDYFTDLNSGNDDVPYIGTFPITNGQPLVILFPLGAANNKFNVIRYPNTQGVKTLWENTITNQGTIPDSVYRSIITIGSNLYIVSREAMSLDSTNTTLTFS
jgi:hypothetical protein